jgi:hypothetical protein
MYTVLVENLEGKRLLERPSHRWKDNTELDLREIGWSVIKWIYLTQDRDQWWALVNTTVKIRVT